MASALLLVYSFCCLGSDPFRYFSRFSRTLPCRAQSAISAECNGFRNSELISHRNSSIKPGKSLVAFRIQGLNRPRN